MPDARTAKRDLVATFRDAGLPFPEDDARDLIQDATGLRHADIIASSGDELPAAIQAQILAYAQRRLEGEPVDHILGRRAFYGREFQINRNVLSPREDTETLISRTLLIISKLEHPRMLDLGTGSGAILITLLCEHAGATGTGTDISDAALAIAQQNANDHGVTANWLTGDWFVPLPSAAQFDLIVSNPPYIDAKAMAQLQAEVRDYDPALALAGGEDGLDAYRAILGGYHPHLAPDGWLAFEIGYDQGDSCETLMRAAKLGNIALFHDLSGQPRVLIGQNLAE